MYYVYLLTNQTGKIYIGYTADLKRRFSELVRGKSYWTRRLKNPVLLYYEAYLHKETAEKRERNLKKRSSSYQGLIKRIK